MSPRATPMSPDERRAALVEATLPLLGVHGRAVSTRQIAEAAGVAEGTIFRVFESKDELVEAALSRAFQPGQFVAQLDEVVDPDAPLRERLVQMVTLLQQRFAEIFGLMRAVGRMRPPDHHSEAHLQARQAVDDRLVALIGDDADQLTVPPQQFLHVVRLLTFAGSHEEISDGNFVAAEQIVDILLDGMLQPRSTLRKRS